MAFRAKAGMFAVVSSVKAQGTAETIHLAPSEFSNLGYRERVRLPGVEPSLFKNPKNNEHLLGFEGVLYNIKPLKAEGQWLVGKLQWGKRPPIESQETVLARVPHIAPKVKGQLELSYACSIAFAEDVNGIVSELLCGRLRLGGLLVYRGYATTELPNNFLRAFMKTLEDNNELETISSIQQTISVNL